MVTVSNDKTRANEPATDESPSIPATWSKGMAYFGHHLPYQDEQGEYHVGGFWTIERSWLLRTWLDSCTFILAAYAYNSVTDVHPYKLHRMHRHVVITEKIAILRQQGIAVTPKSLRSVNFAEKGDVVCNEMRHRLMLREKALSVCSRTPRRFYDMGIKPWNATGEHFAHIITVNEEALKLYLDYDVISEPPDEIHPLKIPSGSATGHGIREQKPTAREHDRFTQPIDDAAEHLFG